MRIYNSLPNSNVYSSACFLDAKLRLGAVVFKSHRQHGQRAKRSWETYNVRTKREEQISKKLRNLRHFCGKKLNKNKPKKLESYVDAVNLGEFLFRD